VVNCAGADKFSLYYPLVLKFSRVGAEPRTG